MTNPTINKETFEFLRRLKANNRRDWFQAHQEEYAAAQENMVTFAGEVLERMRRHDHIETASGKKSLFRIYRDVRFSKDKAPYKTYWHGYFRRATKLLRGGYYYHLEPGNSHVTGGFFGPNADDLKRIREDIRYNHEEWRKLLGSKKIKANFGGLSGEQLKTAPQGFAKDDPAIGLLRYKQFLLHKKFTDSEVLSPGFAAQMNDTMKLFRPFFDYMSEVLTTDANGEPLY